MNRVADLVNSGDYAQALVRLWVLAGQRADGTSRLNEWERSRGDDKRFAAQTKAFINAFQEASVTADDLSIAPLAFIVALDEALALLLNRRNAEHKDPVEEDGKRYWLIRIDMARRGRVPTARQTGTREAWFRWHAIIPTPTSEGIEVTVVPATGRLAHSLNALVVNGSVTLDAWVGHFSDTARLQWDDSPEKKFRLRAIEPAEARHNSIRDCLQRAAASRAAVLVLPEFAVDLSGRKLVADWLAMTADHPFYLVVAGSFHEDTPDGCFNTAEVWNHLGEPVLKHRKLRLYGEADGLSEDVGEGNRITVMVTAIGTVSLLICKDFMDVHPRVANLLREVPVDWILVPSYGDERTVKAHRQRAESLAKVGPGTSSIVANQRNVEAPNGEGDPLPGFAVEALSAGLTIVEASGGLVRLEGELVLERRRRLKIVK